MKSRRLRVTFYEALAMQEDEKEQSYAVGQDDTNSDHQVSEEVLSHPKLPLIPDEANKVAKVKCDEDNQKAALLFFEESGVVTH